MTKLGLITLVGFFMANIQFSTASILDLKVTEIMYNPSNHGAIIGDNLEFIELKNTGSTTISVNGLQVLNAISYTFGDVQLAAGEIIVLVSDSISFHVRYPNVPVLGQYTSQLANSGEKLILRYGNDTIININYNDNVPWPILGDGLGFSIVPTEIDPSNNQNSGIDWTNSVNYYGSPGEDEPTAPIYPDVYINELLSHTDLPEVDAVEIFNNGSSSVDISGWFLTDSRSLPYQYKFPDNTILNAGEYLVLDENDFNAGGTGFKFNRSGENCYLIAANPDSTFIGFANGVSFEGQYNGTSFGIYPNSENKNHFVAQSEKSLGSVNAYPRVGPVVISRVMYHPNSLDDEFIVIESIVDTTVNLWHSWFPDSTWRVSGVGFDFPTNTSIAASEKVVLSPLDPALFRLKYSLDASDQVFQYTGKLSNSGEELGLWALDRTDTNNTLQVFMPIILLDAVEYDDNSPWPLTADGLGDFLLRDDNNLYGNESINWRTWANTVLTVEEINDDQVKFIMDPYAGGLKVILSNESLLEGLFSLYDLKGAKLLESKISDLKSVHQISNLSEGIYIGQFQKGNKTVQAKIYLSVQ